MFEAHKALRETGSADDDRRRLRSAVRMWKVVTGMYIYLIRHGETEHNRDRRYQGQIDVPLSKEGKAGLMRAGFEPGIVYVSGLVRTLQTAELLFPEAEYRSVPGLNEMDFGLFDGRSAAELERDPAYREWVDNNCESACPDGEDMAGFVKRVSSAFEEVIAECLLQKRKEAVIVTHGGTIMALASALARPVRGFYDWITRNGAGYLFEYEPCVSKRCLRLIQSVNYSRKKALNVNNNP